MATAIGVLAAPALTAPSSRAADLTFPYVADFDDASGGTLSGDAELVGGRLRLTEDLTKQAGAWSTDDTFPADAGLEIEFDYAMYTDKDDPGADGLLLSLADGAAPQGVGAFGAALGYACRHGASQGAEEPCDLEGLPGGFAAVALDRYGNFSLPLNGSGPGAQPESVIVRGSGDGLQGYRYVAGAHAPGDVGTDGPRTRTVRVTLLPGHDGELSLTVRLEAGGGVRTVLDAVPLHGAGQAPLPETLRLGFAAGTGTHLNVHEVERLRVWQPADLAVEHDMPASAVPGAPFEYTVTARNVGINGSSPSPLEVDVPDDLEDVTWTCLAAAGSACATASGADTVAPELDLPRGGSATVTVRGRVATQAAEALESTATVTPAPQLADVHEKDNVSRATAVLADAAHVETDKSVAPSTDVEPGDELVYTVTARNRGPGAARDVGAVDDLPAALRFVGSDDGCTATGQRVSCASGAPLEPGASTAFRIRVQLDPEYRGDGSDVVNVATATSPSDPDGGDESPAVSIGVIDPDGGDGGPDDGGDGGGPDGGGPGGGGPGTGGVDDGDGGPVPAGDTDDAGTAPRSRSALAYTGVDDLVLVAALAGTATAAGMVCWWLARRRARRGAAPAHAPTDDRGQPGTRTVRRP